MITHTKGGLIIEVVDEEGEIHYAFEDELTSDEVKEQERSYSEEEVEIILETLSKVIVYQGNDYRLPYYFEFEIEQVIKQFKKK